MARRKDGKYFAAIKGAPPAISFTVKRRVHFSEVDVMGIVWYGRYPLYFEEASQELGRRCGLSFNDFYQASLRAPIVQFHIDYHLPLRLDEEFTSRAIAPWCEGAKLLTEYEIKNTEGAIVATAYTVQMFIDSRSEEVYIATPQLLEKMRQRWLAGEFKCLI
ncbi:MAG: acyl-CoA thioesterase [Candidatus Omnitrophica bacterium]|nr:acyl-CoA thioesterase [Candidatus Omnitrophota bacterium]